VLKELGLFPCPGCGGDGAGRNDFCPECRARLKPFAPPRCPGCGGTLTGALAQCSQCLAEPLRPWRYAVTCFAYRDFGRDLIRRLKFGDFPELALPLGRLAAEAMRDHHEPCDLLTAIPLHYFRWWRRSYNQSALFTEVCAKELGVPFRQVLYRTRPTPHQADLPRRERLKNLKGAFAMRRGADVTGLHVWLCDDVFTTGATLHEAATVLLKAGAADVRVLTLARA